MAEAIEGKSLSILTRLASEPPLNPLDCSSRGFSSLVLYIAKVPGSRDVFLSPLKPRQKVVTAEDIEASLYFLHVHGPEDAAILKQLSDEMHASEDMTDDGGLPISISQETRVHRKPLPFLPPNENDAHPVVSTVVPHPLPPLPPDHIGSRHNPPLPVRPKLPTLPRKPVGSSDTMLFLRSNVTNTHNIKPGLTAQPCSNLDQEVKATYWTENSSLISARHIAPSAEALKDDISAREHQQSDALAYIDSHQADPHIEAPLTLPPRQLVKPQLPRRATAEEEVTITLIRRDLSSGEQWNVATITDSPVFEVTSDSRNLQRSRKKGQPLYIDILNSGYRKFAVTPDNEPKDGGSSASSVVSGSIKDESLFKRRLWMEGSIFEQSSRHRKISSVEVDNMIDVRRHSHFRSTSELLIDSRDSQSANATGNFVDSNKKRVKAKNYTFLSPWNGRCEFSAGVGNTLKCRHSMPLQIAGEGVEPVVVSELRFNLPSNVPGAVFSKEERERDSYSSSRRSMFLGRRKMSEEQVYPAGYENERLDLALGQERAGGGFAGKQAKLGKLIIEAEGLKMLDLLVAANMSLWWRAYEKG